MNRAGYLIALLFFVLSFGCSPDSAPQEVTSILSPDRQLQASWSAEDSEIKLDYQGTTIATIRPGELGEETSEPGPRDLKLANSRLSSVEENWERIWGQRKSVRNAYSELQLDLGQSGKVEFTLILRLFDDGLAFRYHLPRREGQEQSIAISRETTQIHLEDVRKAWRIPADFDSYEKVYVSDSAGPEFYHTPATFETSHGVISIHEAHLQDFPAMYLSGWEDLSCHLVPGPEPAAATVNLPFTSPWRTIQFAPTAARLAESEMIANLNPPNALAETDWIRPMRYIGIWWGMHLNLHTWHAGPRHGATTERTRAYIDFAAAHGVDAVLVEGWNTGWERWGQPGAWDYVTPYPDFDLQGLAAYAQEKGVALIGHHETGGDAATYAQQLDTAMAQLAGLGIHALKTGYAGSIKPEGYHHHGEYMVRHYADVVEAAAMHHVMLDVHEPIKPTGEDRTWPHMMTREGVRGMEWNAWSEGNPPGHECVLPFTRGLAGPIDYTPGIYDLRFDRHKAGYQVRSTFARQLALYVVLYSPMQMAADLLENLEEWAAQPDLWYPFQHVPLSWDESRFLQAEIGDQVTVARRKGEEWWIGAITDEEARRVNIDLALDPDQHYTAIIWSDGVDADWDRHPHAVDIDTFSFRGKLHLEHVMAPAGGLLVLVRPQKSNAPPLSNLGPLKERKWEAFTKVPVYQEKPPVGVNLLARSDVRTSPEPNDYTAPKLSHVLVNRVFGRYLGDFERYRGDWIGWQGQDEVVITFPRLEGYYSPRRLILDFLHAEDLWALSPRSWKLEIDTGEGKWIPVTERQLPDLQPLSGRQVVRDTFEFRNKILLTGMRLRIRTRPKIALPDGKTEAAWLLMDEVILR